jgi:hypothetical protein
MLSSSAVELKKQGKNNLFLYELCFEIWTIQEGKENSLSECWGGYSSKKRAMTSSIIDDCGVLGARFFREAPAGCCGCEAGAGWVWHEAGDGYGAGRVCGAEAGSAAIGAVPYRERAGRQSGLCR